MPIIDDDDAAAHGGPLKYWLNYRLSVFGGLKGQWIALGLFVLGIIARSLV